MPYPFSPPGAKRPWLALAAGLLASLPLLAPRACLAADAQAIHRRLMERVDALPLARASIVLEIAAKGSAWPADQESFAYELTDPSGESRVHAQAAWAERASDDEAAFVLAHETAHALCGHAFKTYGLYALRTRAVGLDLALLAESANADMAFQFGLGSVSKAMEDEADAVGAALAAAAGRDALAGARSSVGAEKDGFSHPDGAARLAAIKAALAAPGDLLGKILDCQRREPSAY